MFSKNELLAIKQSLDLLRIDLVKLYSVSKLDGMSVERIEQEKKLVEELQTKILELLKQQAAEVWGVAKDLCLNPIFVENN